MIHVTGNKKEKSNILHYKGKPLVRKDNMIYYGDPEENYVILLIVENSEKINDLDVSTKIQIILQKRNGDVVKKAVREGLYSAMDIGSIWLMDALEQ